MTYSRNTTGDTINYANRFIRDEELDQKIDHYNQTENDYGNILAKKYYDKLFKEYAIIDLSRYKTGQL